MAHDLRGSRTAACYRLRGTRPVTQFKLDMLLQEERRNQGRRMEQLLGIPQRDHQALRNQVRIASSVWLRSYSAKKSRAKLVDVVYVVDVDPCDVHHRSRPWASNRTTARARACACLETNDVSESVQEETWPPYHISQQLTQAMKRNGGRPPPTAWLPVGALTTKETIA